MVARKLAELPRGSLVFIDANVLHLYLRGPKDLRETCAEFLERIEAGEVKGYTSPLVIDELAYKLLLKRIEETHDRNPLAVIEEKPVTITEASHYVEEGLAIILGIENLGVVSINRHHTEVFTFYMTKYSLLPSDAMHLAVMVTMNCKNIASTDDDFDRVPEVVKWF